MSDQFVQDRAPLFVSLAHEPGFARRPDIAWSRALIIRMMEILRLPTTMTKCLGLAEVIALDDDDGGGDDDDDAAADAGQPHVIEMIDDGEWNEIFNAQGICPQEIELFKIAMRFLKDELSNYSTVALSISQQGAGGSQGTGSNSSSGGGPAALAGH